MGLSEFAIDVEEGLSKELKSLPSKYFYDERGDKIFQEIMKMKSYYLTKAEFEIFEFQGPKILELIKKEIGKSRFQLVEFGAGDGLKTKLLLEHLVKNEIDFQYVPIDISSSVLKSLKEDIQNRWPSIDCREVVNTYEKGLEEVESETPKVILFLGSNLGNFEKEAAKEFVANISKRMKKDDFLIFGIDLKKKPKLILEAYNDPEGITRAFNLNLLERINRELGGDFQIDKFSHYPIYDPVNGICKSFLISNQKQEVRISELGRSFEFEAAEPIHTELSIKYSIKEIEELLKGADLQMVEHLYDCKHYFVDTIWKK